MEASEEKCLGTQLLTVLIPNNVYLGRTLKQKFTDHPAERLQENIRKKITSLFQ